MNQSKTPGVRPQSLFVLLFAWLLFSQPIHAQAEPPSRERAERQMEEGLMAITDQTIEGWDRDRLVLGILAGFAVSASVAIATKIDDKRKRLSVILELLLVASFFLIMGMCVAWYFADAAMLLKHHSITRFPDSIMGAFFLYFISVGIGLIAITLAISLLGFIRSWLLGFGTLAAAIAAFIILGMQCVVISNALFEKLGR